MSRAERAAELFNQGYNCAQAVVLAFSDILGEDEQKLARNLSGFGGGFSRLREVCGAVSGMTYVLGFLAGYSDPKDGQAKMQTYDVVQSACQKFQQQFGSVVCRDLLKEVGIKDGDRSGRPCVRAVAYAASLVEEYLSAKA